MSWAAPTIAAAASSRGREMIGQTAKGCARRLLLSSLCVAAASAAARSNREVFHRGVLLISAAALPCFVAIT